MSSRRKQSKPIGFVAEGTDFTAPDAGAEDDTSSRSSQTSSHTSSHASSHSSSTRSYSSSSNTDSADTNTNSKKEDTASPTDVEATTNQNATADKSMTNDLPLEEAMPSIDPVSEDATVEDDSPSVLKVASVKEIRDEDLRAPSTNPVVDALIEGDDKEDSLEPGEVVIPATMKRKRLDESGLSLTLSQNGETGDVFEYPDENMGDFEENLDDDGHQEDEEYDDDEVDGLYDENSMNGEFSLNDEYSDQPGQNYYAHGNKRVMINKHSPVSGQYPVLYNDMHTDAGEYGMYHQNTGDNMRVNAINSAYDGEDSGLLSFKCKVCGKGFKHRRSLNRHVKLHSGEKNFHCPYCATAFARSDHLKAHIRTHNNSKPFRCSICQCGYSTQAALKVHIAHHHSKSKFKCVLCNDLEFHSQLALEGHIYKMHSKENGLMYKNDMMNSTQDHEKHGEIGNNTRASHNELIQNQNHRQPVIQNNKYSHPHGESYENSQFNNNNNNPNYTNRVHMADINNYQHENNNSPEYLGDETTGNSISYNGIAQDDQGIESGQTVVTNGDFNEDIHQINGIDSDNQEKHHHSDNDGSQHSIVFEESPPRKQLTADNSSETSLGPVRHPETATFIDTYGEDDEEQHNKSNNTDSSIGNISQMEETLPITLAMKDTVPDNDEEGVIIEESASTGIAAGKKTDMHPTLKMALKTSQPVPHQAKLNPPPLLPAPRLGHNSSGMVRGNGPGSNENYCDMCNARFSNSESFAAHMRVVHPNIPNKTIYQNGDYHPHGHHHPGKMPYLSNLLNKGGEPKKAHPNQITPVINGNKSDSHKDPTHMLIHGAGAKTTCTIPNCNCSPTAGPPASITGHQNHHHQNQSFFDAHQANDIDLFSAKETHYTCGQCSLTLLKLTDFIAHIKQEHCVEVFRCILCKQMQLFDNLSLLREHFFQVHQSIRTEYYRCRYCPLNSSSLGSTLFLSAEELAIHIDQVHQQTGNSSLTPTHSSRNIHMRMAPPLPAALGGNIYAGGQPAQFSAQHRAQPYPYGRHQQPLGPYSTKCFKCPYCDSDFSQQNYLNQHIHIAHNSKQTRDGHEYPTLKQTLQQSGDKSQLAPTQVSIQPSTTSNNGTPTFPCQYCRNTFTNRQQLERHVRIHISSIDRKCNICDKHFASHEALSQHKLTHCKTFNSIASDTTSNNKQPVTSKCDANSSQSSTGSAVCVYCKQNIEDENQFKEHFKLHNNIGQSNVSGKTNSFICICCRQTLTSNNEYNIHMRHHLKRSSQQQQQTPVTSNEKPEPNESAENDAAQATNNDKADQPAAKASSTSSKLKCSQCEVKFEEWRELADHIAKDHASTKNSDSTKASEPATAPETNQEKSGTEQPTSTQPIQPVIKAEKNDNPSPVIAPAIATITNGQSTASNPASNNSSPRSLNSTNTSNSRAHGIEMTHSNELCEICSSKFDCNQKLQAHLLTKHEFGNTNASVYTCPVCDESYSQPESLLAHANIHGHAARIYKCSHCTLAFVFKSQLINHSFSHRNQAPQVPRPKLNNNNNHQTMYQKMPPQHQHRHSLPHQSHNGMHPMHQAPQVHHGFTQSPSNGIRHPLQQKPVHHQRDMPGHMGGAPMAGPYGHMSHMNPHDKMRQQIHMNAGPPGFRCDECNAMFDSFRTYQMHNQSFHGRTMILNGHAGGSNGVGPGINQRMNDMYNKTNVF